MNCILQRYRKEKTQYFELFYPLHIRVTPNFENLPSLLKVTPNFENLSSLLRVTPNFEELHLLIRVTPNFESLSSLLRVTPKFKELPLTQKSFCHYPSFFIIKAVSLLFLTEII